MLYGPFSHFLFFGKSSQGRTFFDVLHRKECYRNFPNGLVHAFWPKLGTFFISCFPANPVKRMLSGNKSQLLNFLPKLTIFIISCFPANPAREERFLCSRQKRMLLRQQKSTSQQVQNIEIFQRGQSMLYVHKWPLFLLVVVGQPH